MKLSSLLQGGHDVVLDTMIFIYFFEDDRKYGRCCEWLLQQAAEGNWVNSTRHAFVADAGDSIAGLLTEHEMNAVPRERWSTTPAAWSMIPLARLPWVEPNTEIRTAAEEMARRGIPSLPVVANGHLLGIISREDVMRFLYRLQVLRRAPA